VDYPADWHSRGGNLSFADGHVETWRWNDPRTMPRRRLGVNLALHVVSPGNPDVARIQEITSRRVVPD
jgi:prepilin-type processing-associated H-X9-DG protein